MSRRRLNRKRLPAQGRELLCAGPWRLACVIVACRYENILPAILLPLRDTMTRSPLSRREFLRQAAVAGTGVAAVGMLPRSCACRGACARRTTS